MNQPRILFAAGASGSGKTLITCGILRALTKRGLKVSSFKCGPDYIDPMFHSKVLKTKTGNLDTFFTDEDMVRQLFSETAKGTDISVIEGVMGFYDGLSGTSLKASTWEIAKATRTPVVLIVNCRGMSRSVSAFVKGFVQYRSDSRICGVILNQMSKMLYPELKRLIEEETGTKVLGYVPKITDCLIESRHLGLVLPEEVAGLEDKLDRLAGILEETLDLKSLLVLANQAEELNLNPSLTKNRLEKVSFAHEKRGGRKIRIGLAQDEAFCFIYRENLRLLEEMGAELVPFSPLHDKTIPEKLEGLLLYGGYPELHAEKLSENTSMRISVAEKIRGGLPCLAECGGFLYLHETMEDMNGKSFEMAGLIPGHGYRTEKLNRFGYITLNAREGQMLGEDIGEIRGHEFHYYDSTCCGDSFYACRPSGKGWNCIYTRESLMAGFPHIYYASNPLLPYRFLKKCVEYGGEQR